MKHNHLRILIAILAISILFAPSTFATTGALKRDSIKKCPDGKHYGYHTSKGKIHWHEAEASNASSGWSAIGPVLSGDPCPKKASNPTPSTAKKAQPSTGSSSSTTKPKTTATQPKQNITTKPKAATAQPKSTTTQPKSTTQPKTTTTQPKTTEKKTETKQPTETKKEEPKTIADNTTTKETETEPKTEPEDDFDDYPVRDYSSDYIKDYSSNDHDTGRSFGEILEGYATLAAVAGGGAYLIHKKTKK